MKIVLATGIYPPAIGGPATYVRSLAEELEKKSIQVIILTYGVRATKVVLVERWGGPLLRWWRYARALKEHAADADIILAFSLVSVGVPLWLCRRFWPLGFARGKSKLVLRLGGDFLWERYTDCGGGLGLQEWYGSRFWLLVARCSMGWLLRSFDHIVFSTEFQEEMYEQHYRRLPTHSVIENAMSGIENQELRIRKMHAPFRLLYLGRFVAFKNIPALLRAMLELPGTTLTLVGEGPLLHLLEGNVRGLHIQDLVTFRPKATPVERDACFLEHDLLVVPSVTEISPNVALEARAVGLPVLLTEETGLSERLQQGMVVRKIRTPEQIRDAIEEVMGNYEHVAEAAARAPMQRPWSDIAQAYLELFSKLASLSQQ